MMETVVGELSLPMQPRNFEFTASCCEIYSDVDLKTPERRDNNPSHSGTSTCTPVCVPGTVQILTTCTVQSFPVQ